MDPSPENLLALRVGGRDFAVEPGRVYLLGADADCDIRLLAPAVRPMHARLRSHGNAVVVEPIADAVVFVNGMAGLATLLRAGDTIRLGGTTDTELRVVRDLGAAEILPDPAMRAAAAARAEVAAPVGPRIPGRGPGRGVGVGVGVTADDDSFRSMIAHELRRAPWLGLSLAAHAVLLLLLWLLFPAPASGTGDRAVYQFQGALVDSPEPGAPQAPPDVATEESDILEPALLELAAEPEPEPERPQEPELPEHRDFDEAMRSAGALATIAPRKSEGGSEAFDPGGGTTSAGFRSTVTRMRQTGLEIVFVFDSTGSMQRSIDATKANIASMLAVLRHLVPQARFGLVTYRDVGPREAYVTRELPLGDDFYGAVNFMHGVQADGGGNVPEAVLAGLEAAFQQRFASGACRVVVLAGDAPPHPAESRKLLQLVSKFAHRGRSFVHTLVTNRRSGPDPDTLRAFADIAERGSGISAPVADHHRLLQQLLSFAFGSQFQGDIDAVAAQIEQARQSPPTWALDLARRGGRELAAALGRRQLDEAVIDALLLRLRADVGVELVDLLTDTELPPANRNAVAHVLRQKLQLPESPIDPGQPRPLDRNTADRLRAACRTQLPD